MYIIKRLDIKKANRVIRVKKVEVMKKVIGYIRVSSDKQSGKRQETDILSFAFEKGLTITGIESEIVSSRKQDRKIFTLIDSLKKGDVLLITELSRLGRSIIDISEITSKAIKKGIEIKIVDKASEIKEINDSIQSQTLIFALGLSAQIERDFISERTKSALRQRRKEGVILGRPKGSSVMKGKEEQLKKYIDMGLNKSAISKLLEVSRGSLYKYLEENKL